MYIKEILVQSKFGISTLSLFPTLKGGRVDIFSLTFAFGLCVILDQNHVLQN